MARMPFYVMATLGVLGLVMAFLNGSDAHFAVSVACSGALALHLIVPSGRRVSSRGPADRLDIHITQELPPLDDDGLTTPVSGRSAGRTRSYLSLLCLVAGYATLAYAWLEPTPTWAAVSAICSAVTLFVLPGAVERRAGKSSGWNFEVYIGSLRLGLRFGDAPEIDADDAEVLQVQESRLLGWDEAIARIDALLPAPPSVPKPAPRPHEVLVGDDVASSLRARWGAPARQAPRTES